MYVEPDTLTMPAAATEPQSHSVAIDRWLLSAGILLLALGLVMVASASMPLAQDKTGNAFYFFYRQSAALTLGLLVSALLVRVPVKIWAQLSPWLLLGSILLLLAVLLPGIGYEVNGSSRWIRLGPLNLQVSELAKLGLLIYVAGYLQRHSEALRTSIMTMLRLLLLLTVVAVLLLLEPDFGTAVVLFATVLGMVFLAGIKIGRFLSLQLLVLLAMAALVYSSDYRWQRLSSFLDPWQDQYGKGYQLTQALIAIGRGEFFGVGLGASIQKHEYLPEAHTDFVFAIIAEELGLFGVLLVIGLYTVIVWRAFAIGAVAERCGQRFSAYLAYGIGLLFGLQSLVNIGVNMGVLPTKGLTLPLLSYGGSSVLAMCIALALLGRIGWEVQSVDTGYRRRPFAGVNNQERQL